MASITAVVSGCSGGPSPNDPDPDANLVPGDDDARPAIDASLYDGPPPDAAAPDAGPVTYPYMDLDTGCAPIFAQNIVPDYYLTIHEDDWEAMNDEFMHPTITNGSVDEPPYHPVQLHIVEGTNEYDPPGVMIRLNGNTSWLETITFDQNPKMQFMIAFNQVDPDGRFEDLRKVKLDMPRSDWTYLQQRVAAAWLRGRAEIPAQCGNNARVFINGEYYGVYTNLEHQDKGFLKRVYGGDLNDGDLWKGGREIKTNEDTFTWAHISAFWHVTDLAGLDSVASVDESMREWASEAVIGDVDGYNQGRANYYLYDHPGTGKFVWLANDLDTALEWDFLEPDTTPVLAPSSPWSPRHEGDWYHYLIALNDPAGVARYVTAMGTQLPRMNAAEVAQWISDWSVQIEDAVEDDPHRSISMTDHTAALDRMRSYSPARVTYLQSWLDCWSQGGADLDEDGYDMCHDCDDHDFGQSPAATEVCDHIDNNCDGRVDNGLSCP